MQKLGKVFSDNVTYFSRRPKLTLRDLRGWGARLTGYNLFLIAAFFILFIRLFHLTVVKGNEYRNLSEENRIRSVTIHASRGILYDRRGVPLVKNQEAYRVTGPCEKDKPCQPKLIPATDEDLKSSEPKSVFMESDNIRQYIYPETTAHVLGYLSEITDEELSNSYYTYQNYRSGDRLGRFGLEDIFEKKLRGRDGQELIEVNSKNERIRSLGKIVAEPGQDASLSLDIDLQKAAYEALGDQAGAVVVSKPKTGEILTLVSTPAFNPNELQSGLSASEYTQLAESIDLPLFNRAITGAYPPGSVFKPIVAVAGLESGKITEQTEFTDTGVLTIGKFSFSNWYYSQYGGTEGSLIIVKAIARSNDIFFYKVGETVGVDEIARWGHAFGLGSKTGIELPGEAAGVMPDREWRKKVRGTEWYLGDTYHLAIGQGELATTPLQVNMWTNTIAGNGVKCTPTLSSQKSRPKADQPLAEKVKSQNETNCKDLKIKQETIDLITEGMVNACSSGKDTGYQGTGWPLFDFKVAREILTDSSGKGEFKDVPVACKTGTAEIGDADGNTHAWFTAFAPVPSRFVKSVNESVITGDPEIVVTVLVEKGGEGSSVAAPIAKKVLEEWFRR